MSPHTNWSRWFAPTPNGLVWGFAKPMRTALAMWVALPRRADEPIGVGVSVRRFTGVWQVGLVSLGVAIASGGLQAQEEPQAEVQAPPVQAAEEAQEPGPPEEALAPVAPSPTGVISVDFKDADIRQVLRVISLKSGVDIVTSPDVEGLVTIKLTQTPWEQALDVILRTYGLTYERKGNVIRVLTMAAVEQEALDNRVFPLNYAKASEVAAVLEEMLSDRGKLKFDERTNAVIVTDLPSTLFQLEQVVGRLDRATPQVHIESRFVETRLTRTEDLGIDWVNSVPLNVTTATAPTTFPFGGGTRYGNAGAKFFPRPGDFSPTTGASAPQGRVPERGGTFTFGTMSLGALTTTLNMLKERVDTRVISNPTIVTLNNKEAFVQVGTDVSIPNFQIDATTGRAMISGIESRSTGILLKVTPYVNPQDEIVLDVSPEITSIGQNRTIATGFTFPDFDVQKAQTQVRLKNGETLAIGGLKRQAERVTKTGVPILQDIPVVGWLFSNRREETPSGQDQLDLLIFLTVRLVRDAAPTAVAAQPVSP